MREHSERKMSGRGLLISRIVMPAIDLTGTGTELDLADTMALGWGMVGVCWGTDHE